MNRIYLQALPPHWIHQAVKLRPSWGSKFGPRVPGCLLCEVDWSVPSCVREAVVSASSLSPGLPHVRIQVEGSTGLSVPAQQGDCVPAWPPRGSHPLGWGLAQELSVTQDGQGNSTSGTCAGAPGGSVLLRGQGWLELLLPSLLEPGCGDLGIEMLTFSCRHCRVVRLRTQKSRATPPAVSPPSRYMAPRPAGT